MAREVRTPVLPPEKLKELLKKHGQIEIVEEGKPSASLTDAVSLINDGLIKLQTTLIQLSKPKSDMTTIKSTLNRLIIRVGKLLDDMRSYNLLKAHDRTESLLSGLKKLASELKEGTITKASDARKRLAKLGTKIHQVKVDKDRYSQSLDSPVNLMNKLKVVRVSDFKEPAVVVRAPVIFGVQQKLPDTFLAKLKKSLGLVAPTNYPGQNFHYIEDASILVVTSKGFPIAVGKRKVSLEDVAELVCRHVSRSGSSIVPIFEVSINLDPTTLAVWVIHSEDALLVTRYIERVKDRAILVSK